ncbi:MAG TPA: CDP-diacylglycerol--glycerol-3-phosphate 3-phosphatidyltransferase [Luteolibacter sp.]|nr:CDP-diacylglycerol--glycerol-3-phosphate 3-phosphatidyltransferase [Luteolibacter sp.]
MNLPNAITFSRLVMTAAFVVAVSFRSMEGYGTGLVLFVIAAISDFVDGWLARKMGLVTPLGKLMDPLADKILVSAAFVFLTEKTLCPVWVTALIIGREFMVTGLRQIAVEAGVVIAADRLGKWKTAFQLTFCIAGLVWLTLNHYSGDAAVPAFFRWLTRPWAQGGWVMPISLWIATALTLISGWNYLWSSRDLLKAK